MQKLRRLSALLGKGEGHRLSRGQWERLRESVPPVQEGVVVRLAERCALAAAVVLLACGIGLWQLDRVVATEPESPARWEKAVLASAEGTEPDTPSEELIARWIVQDLAEEHDRD
jgi:hypothetical protein